MTYEITRGWLYVNSDAATFVSDDPNFPFEKYNWSSLSNQSYLEKFLQDFKPSVRSKNISFQGYYLKFEESTLNNWFNYTNTNY